MHASCPVSAQIYGHIFKTQSPELFRYLGRYLHFEEPPNLLRLNLYPRDITVTTHAHLAEPEFAP